MKKTSEIDSFIKEYEDGFNVMYGSKTLSGGSWRKFSKKYKYKRNNKPKSKKRQTKNRR